MPHISYIFSDIDSSILIIIMLNKERTKKLSNILRKREKEDVKYLLQIVMG